MHIKAIKIKTIIILVVLYVVFSALTVFAISSSDITITVPYYGYFFQSESTDPVYYNLDVTISGNSNNPATV